MATKTRSKKPRPVGLSFDSQLLKVAKQAAAAEHLSFSGYIRKLVRADIERREKEATQ